MKKGFDCGEIVLIEDYRNDNCIEMGIVLGYAIANLYYNEDTNRLIVRDEQEFIGDLQTEAQREEKDLITLRNFRVTVQHICYIEAGSLNLKETENYINALYRQELNTVLNPRRLRTYSGFSLKSTNKKSEDYSNYLVKSAMMNKIIREYLTYIVTRDKVFEKIEELRQSYGKTLMSFEDLVETKDFEIGKVYIREDQKGKEYRFMLCVRCNKNIWNFLTLKGGITKENFMKEYIAVTSKITTTNLASLHNWLEQMKKIRYGQYVLYKEKYKYYSTEIVVKDKSICNYI